MAGFTPFSRSFPCEIMLGCPEDLLEEAERTLKEAMVQVCRDYLKVVAIPEPEVVVGRAWIKK